MRPAVPSVGAWRAKHKCELYGSHTLSPSQAIAQCFWLQPLMRGAQNR